MINLFYYHLWYLKMNNWIWTQDHQCYHTENRIWEYVKRETKVGCIVNETFIAQGIRQFWYKDYKNMIMIMNPFVHNALKCSYKSMKMTNNNVQMLHSVSIKPVSHSKICSCRHQNRHKIMVNNIATKTSSYLWKSLYNVHKYCMIDGIFLN